jgi:hypothetical protein
MLKNLTLILLIYSSYIFSDYTDYIYKDRSVTYNSLGQGGLIHTPSAEQKSEATIDFTVSRNKIWKMGTLTVTPFSWLEASYFYYRPEDIFWGSGLGLYLDKGFNIKFSYKSDNKNIPSIAIGLDDFAGTGLFSREYIVTTSNFNSLKLTAGIGWGKYANDNLLENPFSLISDNFDTRFPKSDEYKFGGKPSYDLWFKGDVSIFGGIEYFVPYTNGIKLKLELDPFNYFEFGLFDPIELSKKLRKKDSDINFGISIPYKYGNIDLSYIKGNTLNIALTMGLNLDKPIKHKKFIPKVDKNFSKGDIKNSFYNDLLKNLNNNNIYLQTANLKNSKFDDNQYIDLTIESPDLRNTIISSHRTALVVSELAKKYDHDFSQIEISHLQTGIQSHKISYLPNELKVKRIDQFLELQRTTEITQTHPNEFMTHEFRPKVPFPVIFKNVSPMIRSHVGSPEKFFYGGISISGILEAQFSRNLILSTIVGYSVYDQFDEKESRPDSLLPNVRTDIVKYMQSEKYIEKLSLDYFSSPINNVYTKFSAGLLELMYSGYGGEILYKPFDKDWMIGYENYRVNKRDYKLMLNTLDYRVTTQHLNLLYDHPFSGIRIKYSYGMYLAGDKGYTLDLSRLTKSGFRAGFFFSRTNVPPEIFGEGSFDKGFYFIFPIDLLSINKSKKSQKFSLRTMTRDGGQKLNIDNNIIDFVKDASYSEIYRGWNEF